MLTESPTSGIYSSKNLVNGLLANLLHTKNPNVCVSLAEIVANPKEKGEIELTVQDLLTGNGDQGEEKKNTFDSLTKVQLS